MRQQYCKPPGTHEISIFSLRLGPNNPLRAPVAQGCHLAAQDRHHPNLASLCELCRLWCSVDGSPVGERPSPLSALPKSARTPLHDYSERLLRPLQGSPRKATRQRRRAHLAHRHFVLAEEIHQELLRFYSC